LRIMYIMLNLIFEGHGKYPYYWMPLPQAAIYKKSSITGDLSLSATLLTQP